MNTSHIKAAFFADVGAGGETLDQVYGAERIAKIGRLTDLHPTIVTSRNMEESLSQLQDLEVIFSTWGMMPLTEAQLDRIPKLRALFYAAGSVRYFARPLLNRGIVVVSAWAANAVPVAEYTLAQILLANKGFFRNAGEYRETADFPKCFRGAGNYGATVSLLGAGQIGRKLIELLRPFNLKIVVFDPFLSDEAARALGVEKVDLPAAFARGNIVSNHLANLPETVGILNRALLSSMPPNATFINTGRGPTVNHEDMIAVLRERSDLTALLDVTDPEPLPRDALLWTLPNVHVTSHIAGSIGDEVTRMADYAIAEFEKWSRGEALSYAVTLEMLERMA